MIKTKKNIPAKNNQGFTLIEVVAVLLLIGILSAVAIPRMSETGYEVVVQRDVIMNHLRYTQIKAMSTNTPWYITFTGNSYQLYEGDAGGPTLKLLPGEENTTATLLAGVSCSPAGSIISYDEWGKPATDTVASVLLSGDRTLTLTKGSNSSTITIVNDTGLLQ